MLLIVWSLEKNIIKIKKFENTLKREKIMMCKKFDVKYIAENIFVIFIFFLLSKLKCLKWWNHSMSEKEVKKNNQQGQKDWITMFSTSNEY